MQRVIKTAFLMQPIILVPRVVTLDRFHCDVDYLVSLQLWTSTTDNDEDGEN